MIPFIIGDMGYILPAHLHMSDIMLPIYYNVLRAVCCPYSQSFLFFLLHASLFHVQLRWDNK
jgi:hypothetical protein